MQNSRKTHATFTHRSVKKCYTINSSIGFLLFYALLCRLSCNLRVAATIFEVALAELKANPKLRLELIHVTLPATSKELKL